MSFFVLLRLLRESIIQPVSAISTFFIKLFWILESVQPFIICFLAQKYKFVFHFLSVVTFLFFFIVYLKTLFHLICFEFFLINFFVFTLLLKKISVPTFSRRLSLWIHLGLFLCIFLCLNTWIYLYLSQLRVWLLFFLTFCSALTHFSEGFII